MTYIETADVQVSLLFQVHDSSYIIYNNTLDIAIICVFVNYLCYAISFTTCIFPSNKLDENICIGAILWLQRETDCVSLDIILIAC